MQVHCTTMDKNILRRFHYYKILYFVSLSKQLRENKFFLYFLLALFSYKLLYQFYDSNKPLYKVKKMCGSRNLTYPSDLPSNTAYSKLFISKTGNKFFLKDKIFQIEYHV